MLCALFDGRELSASELAYRAGVAPNIASAHLAKLIRPTRLHAARGKAARLPSRRRTCFTCAGSTHGNLCSGKDRFALAVAHFRELQAASSCYDHLAGRLGVALTDALVKRRVIRPSGRDSSETGETAEDFFRTLDVDLDAVRAKRRHFARQCIDWSERRPHLAGALGSAVLDAFIANSWIERNKNNRAVTITPAGRSWLADALGIDVDRHGR